MTDKIILIRSTVFNFLFVLLVMAAVLACLPLLLLPRKYLVCAFHVGSRLLCQLEKHVLGLTYRVEGLEHLPKEGSYIVASKHMSAYETMKLFLLFGDPSIILKRELTYIPVVGWFLKKLKVIDIDRSSGKTAMQSIIANAHPIKEQGRPIVIYPQGTRVRPGEKKPYKQGIVRIQEATGLPIIPVALNSGLFWPKNSFIKKSGIVTFKILPPVPYDPQRDVYDTLQHVETLIETETQRLLT